MWVGALRCWNGKRRVKCGNSIADVSCKCINTNFCNIGAFAGGLSLTNIGGTGQDLFVLVNDGLPISFHVGGISLAKSVVQDNVGIKSLSVGKALISMH